MNELTENTFVLTKKEQTNGKRADTNNNKKRKNHLEKKLNSFKIRITFVCAVSMWSYVLANILIVSRAINKKQ